MRGLVLGGGGTKGAYQIGAYKALRELNIDFDGVTGTSIGALNGAFIVQGDMEIMEDIWLNRDYTSFMDIEEEFYQKHKNVDMTAKSITSIVELINKARKNEGIDITPLKNLLNENIDEAKIRNSGKDFGLVTVYIDKKIVPRHLMKEDIEEGKLVDFLIASASLPIFQLDKLDDRLYLDGFLSDNLPIGLLVENGYREIVAIALTDDSSYDKQAQKFREKGIDVVLIKPSRDLGGSLNKDKDRVTRNVRLGYMDTMKVFDRYEGVNYFFVKDERYDENFCFEMIRHISEETICEVCELLKIKREPNLRTLLEVIVPKLGNILELEKNFTYKDIFYSIYENKLEENNMDVLNLYDFSKVIDLVNLKLESYDVDYKNNESKHIILLNKKEKNEKAALGEILLDFKKQMLMKAPTVY